MRSKIEDIMTPDPLTLEPTATVGDAYTIMRERGFRHVPISESGLLLGLISMTDIGHLGARVPEVMARPLHEVMTKKLITIKPDQTVEKAAVMMASNKINCLPVVDGGTLIGIVTTYDLLDALAKDERDSATSLA